MDSRAKNHKQRHTATLSPQTVKAPRRKGFLILGVVLAGAGAFGGTWAFCEFVLWNRVPSELVGKWVVTEGPQEGATFDFYRNGNLRARLNAGGREAIMEARVRVEDKKIYSTTTNPNTGQDDTKVLMIRTLTARELVVEDEQGTVMKMQRAR
jgi:uncharacterized protein (TIGR03066 family)